MVRDTCGAPGAASLFSGGSGPGEDHSVRRAAHASPWVRGADGVGACARLPTATPSKEPQRAFTAEEGAGGKEQSPFTAVRRKPSAASRTEPEPPCERVTVLDTNEEAREGGAEAGEQFKRGLVRQRTDASPVRSK